MKRFLLLLLFVGVGARPARAYIDTAPTLGRLIRESSSIVVLEVAQVSIEKRVVVYRKIADLKGQSDASSIKHQITDGLHPREPKLVMDLAQPGRRAVCFVSGPAALVCLGPYWYEAAARAAPWWVMTRGRSELSLAYIGSADRLQQQVADMLAGHEVVITAVRHGARGFRSDEAVAFKNLLRGSAVPVWRYRASLRMPGTVNEMTKEKHLLVAMDAGGAEDVAPLLPKLKDRDARTRANAAQELGMIGRKAHAAVPALTRALSDSDEQVRLRAAEALVRIAPTSAAALPVLLEGLKNPSAQVRKAAAEALGDVGPDAVIATPALVKALADPDAGVRWAVAEALGRGGTEAVAAVPALEEALKDSSIRLIAADALGEIGPGAQHAVPALTGLLQDADHNTAWTAALALVRIRPAAAQSAAPLFVEALKSSDPRTRWDAIWYLQQLPKPELVVTDLVALLKNSEPGVRASVIEALGNIGGEAKSAIPQISQALKDEAANVRIAASQALALIGVEDLALDLAAAPPLLEVLNSSDPAVPDWMHDDAEWYLVRLGPKEKVAVPAFTRMLKDKRASIRSWALEALARLGSEAAGAMPAIRQALHDDSVNVRLSAAEAAWEASEEAQASIPVLTAALVDSDEMVRARAADLLGHIGSAAKPAGPALADAYQKDTSMLVRLSAAEALWKISHDARPVVTAAIAALKADEEVRLRALNALKQIGADAKPALANVRDALKDSKTAVRLAAAETLLSVRRDNAGLAPVLATALTDDDDDIMRVRAANMLARLGPQAKAVVPAVRQALRDRSPAVRVSAAIALWRIDHDAALVVPVLKAALGGRSKEAREQAAGVLEEIGSPGKAAVPAPEDQDGDVRRAATKALTKVGNDAEKPAPVENANETPQAKEFPDLYLRWKWAIGTLLFLVLLAAVFSRPRRRGGLGPGN
jgi:HEAT repeat protein